jgi:hypothetical protein
MLKFEAKHFEELERRKIFGHSLQDYAIQKAQIAFDEWIKTDALNDMRVLGLTANQINELKTFWLTHHTGLPEDAL